MQACDVATQSLWTFVGLMQLMFGMTWLAAARLSDPLRHALVAMAWFNLLTGASLVLMGMRGDAPHVLAHTVPNLMQVVGYVALWQAGSGLCGAPAARTEQRWLVLLGCTGVLVMGLSPDTEQQRMTVAYVANAWVVVRAGAQMVRQLRLGGADALALALQATCTVAGAALVLRAAGGMWLGAEVDQRFNGQALLGWALVAPVFAVNMLAAYQAFGRVVHDANRLARADTLTGLADDATLTAALVHAWRRFVQWQRPVALLELAVDQLAALRVSHGADTANAVLAELTWKLKLALRPGDLPAHGGDGVLRILLPDTAAADAQALAQQLVDAVGADAGLHPDFGQRLTLSAGLACAIDSDRSATALGLRARAQRLCAQHAGGDQLVADDVLLATPPRGMPLAAR